MSRRRLVIITTRLPPATCGVGSHSALLRKHWPETEGPVEFLVVDGAAAALLPCASDRIVQFDGEGKKLSRELDRIGTADVILHYAGRAYHRFGCPIWMPGVLARWKKKFPAGRLLLFAHEVPGRMPVTSPHFWLGKLSAWILRRLIATADVVVTNTETHREKLRVLSGGSEIQFVPVGSNIEDIGDEGAARTRTEFVIFGLSFGRLQALRVFENDIVRWLARGQLTKLHIIGPGGDAFSAEADLLLERIIADNALIRHGALPADEVSRLLDRAQFALTNVTAETWSKSGAFMACASHHCAPVLHGARGSAVPLSCAVQADEVASIPDEELIRRARTLAAWYHENADWPIVARRLATLLEKVAR